MIDRPHIHPSFPQPDDHLQVVWRYMDSDKFEWLLEHGRLFMPTADNLGDPREGSTPPGGIEWWKQEYENAATEEHRATVAHNRQFFAYFAKNFRPHYYISCWHMNKHENYSMWRCYTNTKRAVAIRTTYSSLRKALPAAALMGKIRYIDYSTDRLPWGNIFEYIMHKDITFRYEAEMRAVMTLPPNDELGLQEFLEDHFALTANPNFRVYAPKVDVTTLIDGIVLHPEASKTYAARVRKLCAAHGLATPTTSRETTEPVY
ncbi:hypothetical protein [Sphingobium sp.]|uniref:hypothetical protein n=1 Tax=Sphingobium sp. TaxID=1912891 RepID=UPI002C43EBB0|nr:hypothetical protein [Sphingobium sp.]HUD93533.1 hypothetical protein [Sphingobium sp.]